jgi:outer membrane protein OmpA-like peptidoglycan-associated protein
MAKKLLSVLLITLFYFSSLFWNSGHIHAQSTDHTLINADKEFINLYFDQAAVLYEKYLLKNPKDFYASRQAAICYNKIDNENKAIDHWTNVYENGKADDRDRLEYAKCLLANYRADEAKKILVALVSSNDSWVAAWGKAYLHPEVFLEDAALCEITEITGINTTQPEYSPVQYKTALLYVTQKKPGFFAKIFGAGKKEKFSVYAADKTGMTSFSNPKIFNKHIQNKSINSSVCFTPDDSTIYFTRSSSPKEYKKAKNKLTIPKLYIFYTSMNSYGLAHPEIKPFPYNSIEYDCAHPTISADGKKLYFTSDMPGTLGGKDIFVCEWKDGAWDKPKNLGPRINTPGNENFPHITEEGILYFSSDYRPGLGGLDVFFAEPTNDDKLFSEAENVGSTINTQFDDFGIFILKGGKTGYFSSNRKNNFRDDDIYYFVNNKPRSFPAKIRFIDSLTSTGISVNFTITTASGSYEQKLDADKTYNTRLKAEKEITVVANGEGFKTKIFIKNISLADTVVTVYMKPKSLKCREGIIIDKDSNTPLVGAKVAIYDEDGNKYLDIVTDASGAFKVCSLPLDKNLYIGSEKKPDYFTNTEKFTIKKDSDIVRNIFAQKIVIGKAIKVDNIYFDKGKFNVRSDAALELDKLVRLMKDNPNIIIELSSHSDCIGLAKDNLLLSDKRAKSSVAYLISKGIEKKRVTGKGYGESKLLNDCKCEGKVVSTCTEEQHAQNRRTEFKVTGFTAVKK